MDSIEEEVMLMREVDLQKERGMQVESGPPRRRGLPSSGRPPDRYKGGLPGE